MGSSVGSFVQEAVVRLQDMVSGEPSSRLEESTRSISQPVHPPLSWEDQKGASELSSTGPSPT